MVERPVSTIHTITPITQWGIWDARIVLNVEDWAGYHGALPSGEHKNILKFAAIRELIDFLEKDLVLQYKWIKNFNLSDEMKAGLKWLKNEKNRLVGPVEWDRIRVNENVAGLEPTIIEP